MLQSWRLGVIRGVLVAAAGSGCAAPYRTPLPTEPHAIVTLRRTYNRTVGESLTEWLLVDRQSAFNRVTWTEQIRGPAVDTLRVPPRPSTFTVKVLFSHSEIRPITDTFHEQVPQLRTESFGCATGTCTREVTDYHTEQRTQYVSHYLEVSDGTCAKDVRFAPAVDHRYVLQFTYLTHGACSLSCTEQVAAEDGQLQIVPCGGGDVMPPSSPPEAAPQPASP
jgi:hypothetical protein